MINLISSFKLIYCLLHIDIVIVVLMIDWHRVIADDHLAWIFLIFSALFTTIHLLAPVCKDICRLFIFFFDCFNEDINTALQLYIASWHEQMVKSNPTVSPDRVFDLDPVSVAMFIRQTEKHNICLFAEVLRLLDWVEDHFVQGSFDWCNFSLNQQGCRLFKRMNFIASI